MDALSGGSPGPGATGAPQRSPFPGGDSELRAAMALAALRNVDLHRLRTLLDRVGSAVDAVGGRCSSSDLRACLERPERRALRALEPAPGEELSELRERGVRVVSYRGPGYPERLLHLHQPPPALYLKGPGRIDRPRSVAVVGTRSATSYGRRAARDLAGELARAGWTVVSGMARGVDAAAHRAALDARGRTTAVLGSGIDHRYPTSNRDLYDRMEEHGLLATEFPPGRTPRKWIFPRRNRIIAALSAGVVVVQAPRKSGALITVDQALELGREIFAVPGPVGSPSSAGTHDLLRSGAGLAARPADVLEVLEAAVPAAGGETTDRPSRGDRGQRELDLDASATLDPDGARAVWQALRGGAETLEELEERSRLPPGRLLALLTELELAGRIRSLPGDRYRPGDPGGE